MSDLHRPAEKSTSSQNTPSASPTRTPVAIMNRDRSNFARGIPLCATHLALINRGEPIIGVIAAPFLDLTYFATKDEGAFCNGQPIRASRTSDLRRTIVSIGDYATGVNAVDKNKCRFAVTQMLAENVERVRMLGSAALDLAFVAEGRTDACVILANKPWDTAAGVLIAREAGAPVVGARNTPHDFDSAETLQQRQESEARC